MMGKKAVILVDLEISGEVSAPDCNYLKNELRGGLLEPCDSPKHRRVAGPLDARRNALACRGGVLRSQAGLEHLISLPDSGSMVTGGEP